MCVRIQSFGILTAKFCCCYLLKFQSVWERAVNTIMLVYVCMVMLYIFYTNASSSNTSRLLSKRFVYTICCHINGPHGVWVMFSGIICSINKNSAVICKSYFSNKMCFVLIIIVFHCQFYWRSLLMSLFNICTYVCQYERKVP